MSSRERKPERADPRAAAEYVATFTAELARIARRHGLNTLSYILDMARLEAQNLSRPANRRHR